MHRFFGDAADQEFLQAGPRLAGRLFPHMTGDLVLERVLGEEEAGRLLAGCVSQDA
ncbi:hypothetical protein ACWC4C_07895 [Streptomyces olivaceoviridis]